METSALPIPPDEPPIEHRFQFTGSGEEYFRIWIVNLLLSVLTLGIYSAWAKVRREQYFHRNTLLDGSGFDYHGDPKAILKGRIIAFVLLFILGTIEKWANDFYYLVVLVASPLIPWLVVRSWIFRSRNTSFRGLHFDFHGTYKSLCKAYLVPFILFIAIAWVMGYAGKQNAVETALYGAPRSAIPGLLLFGAMLGMLLLLPVLLYRLKAFQFNNLAFGASRFEGRFRLKSFYGIFLRTTVLIPLASALVFVALPLVVVKLMFGEISPELGGIILVPSAVLMYMALLLGLPSFFAARMTNLIWSNTRVDKHDFKSDQTFRGLVWINVSNLLLVLLTLGLYWPWANVRMARYRAEHTAVLAAGSLDGFIAGATREKSAIGEEVADAFDFDIAF
ncbi:MAG: DUF898 domain-containing protein [Azoarcus sp.]|jgi:uncharacterized membrane protein YjgN (DUF898 family)|nr:DUF898 domain-containing protein [Azoarcus sp.]